MTSKAKELARKFYRLVPRETATTERENEFVKKIESLLSKAMEEAEAREFKRMAKTCEIERKEMVEKARSDERNECAKILEGEVLLTGDEFDPKNKLKVFNLLVRLASAIRCRGKSV